MGFVFLFFYIKNRFSDIKKYKIKSKLAPHIPVYLRPSVLMRVGLSGCRTIGPSDYRAVGLSGRRNIRRSSLWHTVRPLFLREGAKRVIFCHITVILQYCCNKTIARSGDMCKHDSCILSLVIKCFGITNTSLQNFAVRVSSVKTKTVREVFTETIFVNKINIHVSSLFLSLLLSKYFKITVILSQILFLHLHL